ncbi:hypothetical protein BRC83_05435 [Halobacteriales archaeon QS_1_68_17]|nr:MAG: hypothetical protein BRC83_05435 [Halobacteriales archaeon QS_1_68_17]
MAEITVTTVDEYEPQRYDAVTFRERVVVCVRSDAETVRLVPLDKVNSVDGPPELFLSDTEIPESFYGGGEYGFVDADEFPAVEQHLEEVGREEY